MMYAARKVLFPVMRGAVVSAVLLSANAALTNHAEAISVSADNRVTAKLASQSAYINRLESLLAKCLSGADSPITVGNELWLCGATNTGVVVK